MSIQNQFPLSAHLASLSSHAKGLLFAFIALKCLLIYTVPLTGDEAYFIVWGQNLSLGYYDHPPAVGWLLYVLSWLGDNLLIYRSFAFLAAVAISYLLYQILQLHPNVNPRQAFYVAIAFFVSPISLMFIVTANDTVLVFFSVLGFFYYAKTLANPSVMNALLAGVFLGLAFLSKYFAVFMLLGLFAYSLVYIKQYVWRWTALMVGVVLLFVAENLYFNATHCWNNILFNFFSRTTESAFQIGNVVGYIAMVIGLMSPLGVYFWLKRDKLQTLEKNQAVVASAILTQVLFASLPLLGILLVVSMTNPVGLHWPLLAVTLLYTLYIQLSPRQLQRLYLFNAYSSLLIGLMVLMALSFIEQIIPSSQKHHVAIYTQPEQVCQYLPNKTVFTLGYSSQSALSYHCGNDDIHVFMSVSKYGREDDKKTDFKAMNSQNLQILITHKKDIHKLSPFFKTLKVKPLPINDETTYYLVTGQGFDYTTYREKILTEVNEKFYTPPDWFPTLKGILTDEPCAFKKRYDFD